MSTPERREYEGRLHIGKLSGGGDEPMVSITLEDHASGVRILDVRMTVTDFANALMAGQEPCTYTTRGLDKIGLERQTATVVVPGDWRHDAMHDLAAAAYQAAEQQGYPSEEGWQLHAPLDRWNGHRRSDAGYRTTWVRWVAPELQP